MLTKRYSFTPLSAAPVLLTGDKGQREFYEALYGVAHDAQEVLHHILDLKEAFSHHVCQHTLSRILGVECKPTVQS